MPQANQRIMELDGEVKDLQERDQESSSSLKVKIKDLENKLQQEKEQKAAELEERDMALAEKKQIITLMQETISQKEQEVQESEDKHKKYIEKARNVIKSMDPKQVSPVDINILRNQLLDRQKMLSDLEVVIILIIFEVKTSLGALSVLVEGKILGSRHRYANDTNLHEKTWPRTTNLNEKVSLAVLKLSRRSMKTDCENQ
ncbi:Protein Hook 3 [Homalodisca vitripennis]|nr:Protein Hook 3 [Homalodisca vitripennis]